MYLDRKEVGATFPLNARGQAGNYAERSAVLMLLAGVMPRADPCSGEGTIVRWSNLNARRWGTGLMDEQPVFAADVRDERHVCEHQHLSGYAQQGHAHGREGKANAE